MYRYRLSNMSGVRCAARPNARFAGPRNAVHVQPVGKNVRQHLRVHDSHGVAGGHGEPLQDRSPSPQLTIVVLYANYLYRGRRPVSSSPRLSTVISIGTVADHVVAGHQPVLHCLELSFIRGRVLDLEVSDTLPPCAPAMPMSGKSFHQSQPADGSRLQSISGKLITSTSETSNAGPPPLARVPVHSCAPALGHSWRHDAQEGVFRRPVSPPVTNITVASCAMVQGRSR